VRSLGARALSRDPVRRSVSVATDGSATHVRSVLDELDPLSRNVSSFAVHTATLDDVFLALTGRTATRPEKETAGV
jgi:ABC-2 type transport system ATP-binding protein